MRSVWVSTRRRAASRRRSECGGEVESAVGPVCVDSLYVEGPGCPLNACVRGAPCSFVPFFLFIRFTSRARGHAPLLRHSQLYPLPSLFR